MADNKNNDHQHFKYRDTEREEVKDDYLKKFVSGISQMVNNLRKEKDTEHSNQHKGNYQETVHYKPKGNYKKTIAGNRNTSHEKIGGGSTYYQNHFIGRYQVLEEIASGGFGTVYRGIDSTLHRKVAIKTIHSEKLTAAEIDLFEKEARVLARCNHPNIVQIYDVGKNDDGPYLVMEFINGPNLYEYIENERARNDTQHVHRIVCSHLISVVDALKYMHRHNIFHQDIKPNNIIVSLENNSPKLVDFGLAMNHLEKKKSTKITGTYAYMPPEKLKGKGDPKMHDIYALGIVLFEMLTGRIAHPGNDVTEIVENVFHGKITFRKEDAVHKELQDICLKCVNKNPKKRYQDLVEFYDALTKYSGNTTEINDYPYLSVITGEQKLIFPLVHKINFLGRTFSNHIVIPDQAISRSQAIIEVGDYVKIKNLSEVNKIIIGSTQLKFDEEFYLSEPQTIQIASYIFHYIPRSQISHCSNWEGETITSASSQQQATQSQINDDRMWKQTVVGNENTTNSSNAHFYIQQLKATIEKLEKEL